MSNRIAIYSLIFFMALMPCLRASDRGDVVPQISEAAQLLEIVSTYLKSAASGDYRDMQKFASSEVLDAIKMAKDNSENTEALKGILAKCPETRSVTVSQSGSKTSSVAWYITSLTHRPSNTYDLVLSGYFANGGSTSIHAVILYQGGRYVVTEW